mgnify:CR=1 FL=1
MGFFNNLKKLFNKNTDAVVMKMITDTGNGYYEWNGKLYHSDIVRACIKPKTKAIGKIVAKHIYTTVKPDGTRDIKVNPRTSIRFLLEEPNEYMTGQVFQEKMANQLSLNGNAFALILYDSYGQPTGLYPVPCTSVEAKYTQSGELYLKFYLQNGKYLEAPYKEVIHLRDDFFFNDIFGDSPQEALANLMEMVGTTDQGLMKAIKNSSVIKWLLKFTQALRDEDLKQRAQDFADNYLNISNNSMGVAAVNSNAEATQIKPYDFVPNAAQIDRETARIYAFFNTNERIVHSNYSENEWVSYYEANVSPVAIQMAGEYTRKLFSRKERAFGNSIVFEASSLTFASMTTKLNLVQLVDRGVMTPNEMRSYFNLAPIDYGDTALLRKDTGTLANPDDGGSVNEDDRDNGNDNPE